MPSLTTGGAGAFACPNSARRSRPRGYTITEMSGSAPEQITAMLRSWNAGDSAAFQALIPVVYAELRRLADSYLRRERPDHTLQATALIHEACLRLAAQHGVEWQSRS